MNRKFQHFQKIEKPVITKNFNIHKFDWMNGNNFFSHFLSN